MDRRKKIIKISLWSLVIFSILLFVVIIIVEYSLSRNAVNSTVTESFALTKSFVNNKLEKLTVS